MQTLELNKMGLAPMEEVEMQEIEGGIGFWKWCCIIAIATGGGALLTAGVLGGGLDGGNGG
jgi:hypothetical protein